VQAASLQLTEEEYLELTGLPSWLPETRPTLSITVECYGSRFVRSPCPSQASAVSLPRQSVEPMLQLTEHSSEAWRNGQAVSGRSTRYREFCRQCLAIVSVTLAAEVLLRHNVKLTASWHASPDTHSRSQRSFDRVVLEEVRKMENDSTKDRFSRRGFLGIGSAALATVAGSLVFDQGLFSEDNTFLSRTGWRIRLLMCCRRTLD